MNQAIAGVVAFNEETTVMTVYPSISEAPGGIGQLLGSIFQSTKGIGVGFLSVGHILALLSAPLCAGLYICLLYTSPSPRDKRQSRMPSSA